MKNFLPKNINRIKVPPIKCQGIKTKLVNFISNNIIWDGRGKWIEPFLGSGVVLFNIYPQRALVSDSNKHIIQFYNDLQSGTIDEFIIKEYLEYCGEQLRKFGKDYYYQIRNEFNNTSGDSLKFIFLNRSGFNGMMRFNSNGNFNVPYNHNDNRYRKSYITKIFNQISNIRKLMNFRDWVFTTCDWRETLNKAKSNDFVYLDPPYIGRHTDYYNNWTDSDAIELSYYANKLDCGYALSMWKENKYRKNEHLVNYWGNTEIREFSHFYHVGPTETLRNEIIEALAIKPSSAVINQLLAS